MRKIAAAALLALFSLSVFPGYAQDEAAQPDAVAEALRLVDREDIPVADRLETVKRILTSDPEEGAVWAVLGELREKMDDDRGALMAFERAVAKDPSLHSAWHWIGILKKRGRSDLPGALAAYDKAIETGAEASVMLNEKAVTYTMIGDMDKAEMAWEEALRLDPDWGVLYANLIKLALMRQKERLAEGYYDRGMKAKRFENAIALQWGGHLLNIQEPENAVKVFAAALERSPNSPDLTFYYGLALAGSDRKEEAIKEFETAKTIATADEEYGVVNACIQEIIKLESPDDWETHVRSAKYIFSPDVMLNPAEAGEQIPDIIDDLDPIIARRPEFADAILTRGMAYQYLGDFERSKADLEEVRRQSPKNAICRLFLSRLYYEEDNMETAINEAREAVNLAPRDPMVLSIAGLVLVESGADCEEVRAVYERAKAIIPEAFLQGPNSPLGPLQDAMKVYCQ